MLGDDALACLKDLKKWLKLYDEKINRLDVARCLAEANLVSGDLLKILAAWPEDATEDRLKSKIALACCTYWVAYLKVADADWDVSSGITGATDLANRNRDTDDCQSPPTYSILAACSSLVQTCNPGSRVSTSSTYSCAYKLAFYRTTYGRTNLPR